MIIHSGRLPERRNASIRRSRLIAFLRRWPEVVRTSACSFCPSSSRSIREIQLAYRLGAHSGAEQARAATYTAAVLAVQVAIVPAVERRLGQQDPLLQPR